jgi:ABC-2 type transport system permease protein
MSQRSESTTGNIYDLGYRHYEGARLGRRHAILSLYFFSLRAAFGLGRRASSKIIPVAITVIAAIPALIQLGIGAIASGQVDLIKPENYFGFIQVTVALFCAAVAPEVVGRDQRTRTLPLYFSRALRRTDYTLAKLAALTTALLFLTLLPELVLFLGNGLASKDAARFWQDNYLDVPRIVAAGLLVAALTASLSLVVAAQTARRAYGTVAVIAVFIITAPIASILVGEIGGAVARWSIFVAPFAVLEGATLWIFGLPAEPGSQIFVADFPLWAYGAFSVGVIAVSTLLLLRRYERIAA